jgi:AraC-like DNA-binding protein
MHSKHRAQIMARFSSIEKRPMDWFRGALFLWGGAWLMYATEYLLDFVGVRWFGTGIVLPAVEAAVLLVFAHMAIKQPILKESERGAIQAYQPKSYTLSTSRMQENASALNKAMAEDKLYLEEDLSLKRLSEVTQVTENHISETLSQFLNSNFFHYVNGYRIEAAKQLLKNSDKQVATIAYESGFNSKSTFNNVFKKSVGTTPTAFGNQSDLLE